MNLIWIVATFVGTFAACLLIGLAATSKRRIVSARLRELTSDEEPGESVKGRADRKETYIPVVTPLLRGKRFTERLSLELASAGLPIRPSEFIVIAAAVLILFQLIAMAALPGPVGHAALGIAGLCAPMVVVRSLQRKRRAAFDAQIVDTLVTMAASFRSGFSLLRAMQMVAQEMPEPISKEFDRIVSEVGVGRTLEDALRASVERIGSYDFDLVVTAVLIHMQVGGNLAEILETIADTVRERTKIMGEMRALTAEGRISGIILVALPIFLGLVLYGMQPDYMKIMLTDPIGPQIIGAAAALQFVGVLIMRRMLALDF